MQSGPKSFGESRVVITFITNLGVTGILGIFRLVQEGKGSKRIPHPSRFGFCKDSNKSFGFINCKIQHLRVIECNEERNPLANQG